MNDAIERLGRNLSELKQQSTQQYQPQNQEQRLAQEIVIDSAAVAAQAHLPERAAVQTFERAYRSTASERSDWSTPTRTGSSGGSGSSGSSSEFGNR